MLMPVKMKTDMKFHFFFWSKWVQVHGVARNREIKRRF